MGGRTYIAKQLGVNQSVVGRIVTKAIKDGIIKRVPPGKFTKTSQRKYTDENPRKIYKVVREVEPRDYKKKSRYTGECKIQSTSSLRICRTEH